MRRSGTACCLPRSVALDGRLDDADFAKLAILAENVPSPAMEIRVSVCATTIGWPLLFINALPAPSDMVPFGISIKRPSRVSFGPLAS